MIVYACSAAGIKDMDIPHRTKLMKLIKSEYDSKYQSLKNDLKVRSLSILFRT